MTDPAEILPCPFCGDAMQASDGIISHIVQTPRCPIDMMGFQMNRIDWNRRALPAADTTALGAVVKPLVWENYDAWTYWAESTIGTYRVEERNSVWRASLNLPGVYNPIYEYDTDGTTPNDFEAAQLAAQADYTARILAAIQPPTPAQILAAALAVPEVAELIRAATAIFGEQGDYVSQISDLGFALEAIRQIAGGDGNE